MADDNTDRPYKCKVQIALPSKQYANHLKDVVSVDKEISNKVVKSFEVVRATASDDAHGDEARVLQM